MMGDLFNKPLTDFVHRRNRRTVLDHRLLKQKVLIGGLTQPLFPLRRDAIDCPFDQEIGTEPTNECEPSNDG